MTTNSMNNNQSVPVSGMGTTTFNIPTTGRYEIRVKSTIPYFTGQSPSTGFTNEITNVTFAADTSGNKNSTYFTFNGADDLNGYYVWFNINSAGVDPAVAGRTGIAVAGATNATAATLATAAITAINASAASSFVIASAGASGHVILTNIQYGAATDAANGTASPGFSFSVTQGSSDGGSALEILVKNGTTILGRSLPPNQTTPAVGCSVVFQATAADVITVVLSSLADADNLPNAVKSVINLFERI